MAIATGLGTGGRAQGGRRSPVGALFGCVPAKRARTELPLKIVSVMVTEAAGPIS